MNLKSHRISAGKYEIVQGRHKVAVEKAEFYDGWRWRVQGKWNPSVFVDHATTKREAMNQAAKMLDTI